MNISIRKMRAFIAIVEEKNFTRAAYKQSISQPAITIIVNQLEEELQEELFVRQGKSRTTQLTATGQKTAETFARVLATFDIEIDKLALGAEEKREAKSFFIQSSLASQLSPSWFSEIFKMLGAGRLVVEEAPRNSIMQRVYERKVTLALVDGKVDQERADYISISDYGLVIAVPKSCEAPSLSNYIAQAREIPINSYILNGHSSDVTRDLAALLRSGGRDIAQFDQVLGLPSLDLLMANDPRCVIIPSFLSDHMRNRHQCRVYEIGPNKIQCPVGLVTSWGYMGQFRLELIRKYDCFIDGNAIDSTEYSQRKSR